MRCGAPLRSGDSLSGRRRHSEPAPNPIRARPTTNMDQHRPAKCSEGSCMPGQNCAVKARRALNVAQEVHTGWRPVVRGATHVRTLKHIIAVARRAQGTALPAPGQTTQRMAHRLSSGTVTYPLLCPYSAASLWNQSQRGPLWGFIGASAHVLLRPTPPISAPHLYLPRLLLSTYLSEVRSHPFRSLEQQSLEWQGVHLLVAVALRDRDHQLTDCVVEADSLALTQSRGCDLAGLIRRYCIKHLIEVGRCSTLTCDADLSIERLHEDAEEREDANAAGGGVLCHGEPCHLNSIMQQERAVAATRVTVRQQQVNHDGLGLPRAVHQSLPRHSTPRAVLCQPALKCGAGLALWRLGQLRGIVECGVNQRGQQTHFGQRLKRLKMTAQILEASLTLRCANLAALPRGGKRGTLEATT
mmetsp:Transcript_47307/g.106660  ORF Transcript_47307/g.106660 Transcript_47307/m.106660 type:complete len:414 (+) Transcript_47307:144-1385(+)